MSRPVDPVLAMSDRERDELLAILSLLQGRNMPDDGLVEDECHVRRSEKIAAWAAEQIAAIHGAVEREREALDELERALSGGGGGAASP